VVSVADEFGLALLPLGSYPGKFQPTMRRSPKYDLERKLFGKKRFETWGRLTGYHCHYSLPKGVFDAKNLELKDLADSRNQEYLVAAYNFLIAVDPALTTFMQSSPFYQGRTVAKDARTLYFRGDPDLGNVNEAFTEHPLLGALPPYVHTGTDIKSLTEARRLDWITWCAEKGVSEKNALAVFHSVLGINWSPLRVNAHGTFEQRGMDMNHLPVLLSVSILLQTLLKYIQDGHLKVVPHDSAKAQPFSFEDKTIYIPPHTYVKKHLQKISAYEGLANDEMYAYCRRLVALVKTLGGDKVVLLLEPLQEILAERKTTSDKILEQAKVLGYRDMRKVLPQNIASQIALAHSRQMTEDIEIIEKMIEKYDKGFS
jgi:hypothetical protein